MGVRVWLLVSASAGLLADSGLAWAQDKSQDKNQDSGSYTTELPAIEVSPPKTSAARPSRPKTATRIVRPAVTRLRVYPTTPLATPGTALAVDKVPSSINFVDTAQIQRTESLNIADALLHNVPAVNINEVAGNPFQPNVEFRGFVGSPVSGTPQGLAVYQNGVRVNEAFGDTVNWDLIPTAAIKSTAVVTNNPAFFGLNALGGAVVVQMKDGFGYQGAEIIRWAARRAGCKARRNGVKRSTSSRSMARSKGCTTTASAISRRPTFAASTATSAIAARTPNSISTSGSHLWPRQSLCRRHQRGRQRDAIYGQRRARHYRLE